MSVDDLRALKPGDRVYRQDSDNFRGLDFIGFMPRNPQYLMFCKGQYQTYLFISDKDNTFSGKWYKGEYDSGFVGDVIIGRLLDKAKHCYKIHNSKP